MTLYHVSCSSSWHHKMIYGCDSLLPRMIYKWLFCIPLCYLESLTQGFSNRCITKTNLTLAKEWSSTQSSFCVGFICCLILIVHVITIIILISQSMFTYISMESLYCIMSPVFIFLWQNLYKFFYQVHSIWFTQWQDYTGCLN